MSRRVCLVLICHALLLRRASVGWFVCLFLRQSFVICPRLPSQLMAGLLTQPARARITGNASPHLAWVLFVPFNPASLIRHDNKASPQIENKTTTTTLLKNTEAR